MRLNRGGQTEARPQVGGPQLQYICIKGLKIPPQHRLHPKALSFAANLNAVPTAEALQWKAHRE